jgi:transposase
VTYPSAEGPVVPPPRDGHRRRFSEADKRRILEEAAQPGASVAEVARRYLRHLWRMSMPEVAQVRLNAFRRSWRILPRQCQKTFAPAYSLA